VEPRRLTITDVARAAGVSRAAASRVINDTPGVAVEVRQRVRRVIDDLGYRPNPAARALASGRTDVVDLVVVDSFTACFGVNPFYGRVVAGVHRALADTAAHMRLHLVAEQNTPELLATIARTADLGALLVNVPAPMAAEAQARQLRDRLVCMGASAPLVPFVDNDNEGGARAAVAHLLERGRRRIAGIHGPRAHICAVQRHDGYVDAVQAAGLTPVSAGGDFRREVGYDAALRLLEANPEIDAFFVACDLMAIGVLQAVTATGRRVPDDVALIGYDDSLVAECSNPPMSSVRQPVEDMAEAATRALLERRLTPSWQRMFPAELVIRASTG
jgi:DNA-binding LacI/PurR family transcriptional regulator